jgi:hypothetical protein
VRRGMLASHPGASPRCCLHRYDRNEIVTRNPLWLSTAMLPPICLMTAAYAAWRSEADVPLIIVDSAGGSNTLP